MARILEKESKNYLTLESATTDLIRSWIQFLPRPGECKSPSLNEGSAAFAIFLAEASNYLRDPSLKKLAIEHLIKGFNLFDECSLSTSFFSSISGYAWALCLLAENNYIPNVSTLLDDVDNLLCDAVNAALETIKIDLIGGVAGLMIYAMARAQIFNKIKLIEVLSRWYIQRFGYWKYDKETVFGAANPDGNLGMAHGIAGVLSAFAIGTERGLVDEPVADLTRHGLTYLRRFLVPTEQGNSYLPNSQHTSDVPRLAWCYGGLGATFAFINGSNLCEWAIASAEELIGFSISQFSKPYACLHDAPLCHGYAGSALLFHLISIVDAPIGENLKKACAQHSMDSAEKIFELSSITDGIRQFPFRNKNRFSSSHLLLEGSLGVCLTLMAIHQPVRPRWCDLLLV